MPPPREPHPVHRPPEERLRIAAQGTHLAQPASGECGVGRSLAQVLDPSRRANPLPHEPGLFCPSLVAQLLARKARHVDEEVHPIEQRTRDSALVTFDLARSAPADPPPVPGVAAGAWVHRTKERNPRRIAERRGYPRDRHVPVLKGLAQGPEGCPAEFGQLVEEEHAVVCQRHFPGARVAPTACQPRSRYGVVWCPERPPRDERPVALPTRAVDLGHFDALLHGERRQYSRHPACQHCLPRARRPTHHQVVRPRRSHLQSPLCVALPGNVRKVLTSLALLPPILASGLRRRDPRTVPEKLHRLPEAPHPVDLYAADGRRLWCVPLRHEQAPQPLPPRAFGHRECPLTPRNPPSSESSPTTPAPSRLPAGNAPHAARMPSAIGRSKAGPSFLRFAGARFTITFFVGNL